jgi:ferric-dicitrate binding protein FerR (iron transport regulator)
MNYKNYTYQDFLLDDFYLESMVTPTVESEKFWKAKIDNHEIDVDEFITAYMVLKDIRTLQTTVGDEQVAAVWNRIEKSAGSVDGRKKRTKLISYFSYAAMVAGLVITVMFFMYKNGNQFAENALESFSSKTTIAQTTKSKQIQISNSERTFSLEGDEATVTYDKEGNLVFGKMDVESVQSRNSTEESFNEIYVPYGKRANLTLSDGTTLWINAGTRVVYPAIFRGKVREIMVDGEVYADVTHDLQRSFVIKTSQLDVKVYGTEFNLSAYKEEKKVDIVLVNGSIGVTLKNGRTTLVEPNQLLSYSNKEVSVKPVDVEGYISWKEGIYLFKNEPIENILKRLSKYYDVTINLPESSSGITCTGKLQLRDDLSNLLNGLSNIAPMNYSIRDETYFVSFR